jgi:titin
VTWTAPASDGGASITSYKVYRSSTVNGTYADLGIGTSTALYYVNTGLTRATTYYYKVSAVNSAGEGNQTSEYHATTNANVPDAPTSLSAEAENSTVIHLWWIAPADNGGSAVTSYKLYRYSDAGYTDLLHTTTGLTAAEAWDTGLTGSTTYYYKVAAVNAVGEGAKSSGQGCLTDEPPPDAPTVEIFGPSETYRADRSDLLWVWAKGTTTDSIVAGLLSIDGAAFAWNNQTDTPWYSINWYADVSEVSVGPHTVTVTI